MAAVGAVGFAGATHLGKQPKQRVPARANAGATPPPAAVVDRRLASGVTVPTATWLVAENARPGTLNWICNHDQPEPPSRASPARSAPCPATT